MSEILQMITDCWCIWLKILLIVCVRQHRRQHRAASVTVSFDLDPCGPSRFWPMTHVTHNPQASSNPKQHVNRPYVKYLNVTKRRYVTIRHLVTHIFIHIKNKLFDRNKKEIQFIHNWQTIVIQQESRVFLSKV